MKSYALLWNHSQRAFHIQTIESMLSDNMRAFKNDEPVGFIVLAFADSFEDAAETMRTLQMEKE